MKGISRQFISLCENNDGACAKVSGAGGSVFANAQRAAERVTGLAPPNSQFPDSNIALFERLKDFMEQKFDDVLASMASASAQVLKETDVLFVISSLFLQCLCLCCRAARMRIRQPLVVERALARCW